MKFAVTYFAGFFSSMLIFSGIVMGETNLTINLILAVMITIVAAAFCHRRHIKKRKEYYDRFSEYRQKV